MTTVGHDPDLERVVRAILAELVRLTGLSSLYLARTRVLEDEQEILFSLNTSDDLHIPEDVTIPWSEGVCRFVVEGGPAYTDNVPEVFPHSGAARLLGIQTFISYPVFTSEGKFFGTLCGASHARVKVDRDTLDIVRERARQIGSWIRGEAYEPDPETARLVAPPSSETTKPRPA